MLTFLDFCGRLCLLLSHGGIHGVNRRIKPVRHVQQQFCRELRKNFFSFIRGHARLRAAVIGTWPSVLALSILPTTAHVLMHLTTTFAAAK
jgi:hypothetical protein